MRLRPFLDRHRDEDFLATKTGDADRRGRVRGDQRVAGAPGHRPRRPDPAAQPGRRDRVADRVQPGRRAGGRGAGPRRRHGPGRSASPATASTVARQHLRSLAGVRLRLSPAALQLHRWRGTRDTSPTSRSSRRCAPTTAWPSRRSRRSAARRGRGTPITSPPRGTSRCAPRRHRPRCGLGARPPGGVPRHRRRHLPAAARARRSRARHRPAERGRDGRFEAAFAWRRCSSEGPPCEPPGRSHCACG